MSRPLAALLLVAASCGRSNFDPDASDAPSDTPAAVEHNIAFVTSTAQLPLTYGADFAGADAVCNARAAAAGLPGTYVAFLSSVAVDARDRLGTARGWVRTDGKPFLDRVSDLTTGAILHPLNIDESGGVASSVLVHTGSSGNGTENPNTCVNYSDVGGAIAVGLTAGTMGEWAFTGSSSCGETARLYCFGIDKAQALTITPATGRRAFMTVQPFIPDSTGIAKADALCNSEATLAGVSGSYRALLATTTASAVSRFDLNGPTWVRLDGIPIVASPLDLAAEKLLTTLNLNSSRTFVNTYALTGATTPAALASPASQSCTDWTVQNVDGLYGYSNLADYRFFGANTSTCDKPILCLEQ